MLTAAIFVFISLTFAFVALRKYLRDGQMSIASRIWFRMALIFAAMSLLILVMH